MVPEALASGTLRKSSFDIVRRWPGATDLLFRVLQHISLMKDSEREQMVQRHEATTTWVKWRDQELG